MGYVEDNVGCYDMDQKQGRKTLNLSLPLANQPIAAGPSGRQLRRTVTSWRLL